jgi:hypothetical protein
MKPFEYGLLYPKGMKDAYVEGKLSAPENANKNFVQRIKQSNPNVAISQPVPGGGRESLRMANSGNQMFPTLENRGGALHRIKRPERPAEVITTDTPEQAELLGYNEYKRTVPGNTMRYKDPANLRTPITDRMNE